MTPARVVAPQLLGLQVVADRLDVSRDSVERWIAAGELNAVDMRSPGARRSRLRVTEDELARFIASRALPSVKDEVARRRKAAGV